MPLLPWPCGRRTLDLGFGESNKSNVESQRSTSDFSNPILNLADFGEGQKHIKSGLRNFLLVVHENYHFYLSNHAY